MNVSGPGKLTLNPDKSSVLVGGGLWPWIGDPDTGAPAGLFLTKGRFVQSFTAAGDRTFTRTGTKIDLCAQLG